MEIYRRIVAACLAVLLVVSSVQAQVVVVDPATTIRNAITAYVKSQMLDTANEQYRRIRRMSRRLSMYTDLRKYVVADPPRWRTHGGDQFLFIAPYNDALIFGDAVGAAYVSVSRPVLAGHGALDPLTPSTRRLLASQLATIELTDAAAIAGTNQTGEIRYNGRKKELPAIDLLEQHVVDPSQEQSATAVLDKISGASLIGARQRQARIQLLAAILEQLLADSKRVRDADAASMNMQLGQLRSPVNAGSLMTGAAEQLRAWRQP
jgi:hypothetical protein